MKPEDWTWVGSMPFLIIWADPIGRAPDRVKDEYLGYVPLVKVAGDIDVVTGPHPTESGKHQAVVTDRARNRAWSGEGTSDSAAATEAVRRFLGDRHAREYVGG